MADAAQSPASPPSRYRSQRHKHASVEEEAVPEMPHTHSEENGAGVVRSKSRYRRKQSISTPTPPDVSSSPPGPEMPDLPSRYHTKHRASPLKPFYQEQVVQAPRAAQRASANNQSEKPRPLSPPADLGASDPRPFSSDEQDSDVEEVKQNFDRERASDPSRLLRSPPVITENPFTTTSPVGELFPPPRTIPQPRRQDGPPQSGQIRATKSMSQLYTLQDEDGGCFGGLFRRKRLESSPNITEKKPLMRPKTAKDEPMTIRPGGGGIVPGIDAPKSAVNSGDRSVLVECGKSQRLFSVTPETTSVDIIKAAVTVMAERISAKSALLLEDYSSVGVRRPLRRYEHIREVMNSWDNDTQNSLLLVDPGTGSIEPELTITGVPKERPEGESWHLLVSYKPGKWEKRYVTLKPEGQVIMQKDPDKPKDAVNICHMSDFDIYSPTPDRLKRKIKPPKKICFAIKSQQKTTMFESTQDFVHFFSTGDRQTADSFYNTMQSWRSWYLVHVRGDGKPATPAPVKAVVEPKDRHVSTESASKQHRMQESMDSHYQLGSFKPLIDLNSFEHRPDSSESQTAQPVAGGGFTKSANQFDTTALPERRGNTVKRSHPPVALHNKTVLSEDEPLANLNRNASIKRSGSTNKRLSSAEQRFPESTEFRETGLLGRNYSQRRKEQTEREAPGAFTTGPNLLNGGLVGSREEPSSSDGLQRERSTRRNANTSDIKRSSSTRDGKGGGHKRNSSGDLGRSRSQRQLPKPLVDLTPEYKEPPQRRKTGRGYKPDQIGAGGLIDNATTPEDPLGIPQTTVFRNTGNGQSRPNGAHDSQNTGLIDLTPQHKEPAHHARKVRNINAENPPAGGLVMAASTPDDPLGLPQNNVFRTTKPIARSGPVSDNSLQQRHFSGSKSPPENLAFTGEGLLGATVNRQGWGTETQGRGVIDGSRAGGKPLVDLTEDSQFVKGSLLNKVAGSTGGIPAPIIDREKRDD